ncbi:ras-GEF domain-containing family member 1B-A-like [Dunckerocampus dactyliophorus]|uniref:ras-GEF domain-containing family member 1B-A-like n=1 Tax=Dunckerocampus dactyliophorus TaxID=161453 RepID=UPI002405A64A|nr:ras-GEF domain-containing family member 1B-A-like [Dunckerocampus dactyliophorus]XP_054613153.1 ras-GEF domain-containing family member 1B-A-like [Dunckerocampus dactyliophorus]
MSSYREMGNSLVSASLEALIQHVAYYPDRSDFFNFLLSSRLFLRPYDLMTRVCRLCLEQRRSGDDLPDQIRFYEMAQKLVQLMTEWTETFPYDFSDERIMGCLGEITHHVISQDEYSLRDIQQVTHRLKKRLSVLVQYEEEFPALNSVLAEHPASLKSKNESGQRSGILSVCDDPVILAQQLTHIELDRMSLIGPEEFIQSFIVKTPKVKRQSSNLEAYVKWFNRLSSLVATEICMPTKKKHRARVVKFFIGVAQQCLDIGNFNSFMAIIAGMNTSSVSRLKKAWNKDNTRTFKILEHLMDPSYNFKNYGTALCDATERSNTEDNIQEKIVIPFFCLLMKDVFFLDESCANRLPNGHINLEKLEDITKPISKFLLWRQTICPFDREDKILQYLITTPVFTEEEPQLTCDKSKGNMETDSHRSFWGFLTQGFKKNTKQ